MAKEYQVMKARDGLSYYVFHKSDKQTPVSAIEYSVQPKKGFFDKKRPSYVVTNQPGASDTRFLSLDSAVNHSIATHKRKLTHGDPEHPVMSVAHAIDSLGQVIHKSASDPRMGDKEQHGLLQVAKLHAALTSVYNKHFGARRRNRKFRIT